LAVNPIATIEFEDIAAELYQTLAEINAEAMLGLHDNSQAIRRTVLSLEQEAQAANIDRKRLLLENEEAANIRQRLVEQNEELKRQIEEQNREANRRERQEDMKALSAFRKLLRVSSSFVSL
jgi:hypothetical protein